MNATQMQNLRKYSADTVAMAEVQRIHQARQAQTIRDHAAHLSDVAAQRAQRKAQVDHLAAAQALPLDSDCWADTMDTVARIAAYSAAKTLAAQAATDGRQAGQLYKALAALDTWTDISNNYHVKTMSGNDAPAPVKTAWQKAALDNLPDAMDAYQAAFLVLWENLVEGRRPLDIVTETRTDRRGQTYSDETSVFRLSIRAACRAIVNRAGRSNPRVTYLEDIANGDPRRIPMYWDIVSDGDGRSDLDAWEILDNMVTSLHLTAKQSQTVTLRLRGLGVREIARTLGVTHPAILKQLAKIQARAIAVFGPSLVFGENGSVSWAVSQ